MARTQGRVEQEDGFMRFGVMRSVIHNQCICAGV
jgi:hypothetical protein